MNATRKAILKYLAHGQASISALVEGTRKPAIAIRAEIDAMLTEKIIIGIRIEQPRLKTTVYRLASAAPTAGMTPEF